MGINDTQHQCSTHFLPVAIAHRLKLNFKGPGPLDWPPFLSRGPVCVGPVPSRSMPHPPHRPPHSGAGQEPANILLMSANFIYLWFVLYYSILEQLKLYNGRGILHGPSKNLATVYLAAFFRSFSQPHKCLMIY